MATTLINDVTRETLRATTRNGGKLIVTLKGGDMLEFRVKGKKTRYEVPIASCFNLAMIIKIEEEYKNKMEEYKLKRSLGQKARKPKRPGRIYSEMWYKSLKM